MESMFDSEVPVLQGLAPWIGGKRALAKRIVRKITAIPHQLYAEPFVGMGGVFLRRPQRPDAEIINDASGDVTNVFRIVKHHPGPLFEELAGIVASRAEFTRQRAVPPETLTDIQRAARFLFLQYAAFGGKVQGQSFGVTTQGRQAFNPARITAGLEPIAKRLAGVAIEGLDFGEFIARYDRSYTLFYCDPPYIGCEQDYGDQFSPADHRRLADHLSGIQGTFILSINDHPLARELYARFNLTEVTLSYTIAGTAEARGVDRPELIISNR